MYKFCKMKNTDTKQEIFEAFNVFKEIGMVLSPLLISVTSCPSSVISSLSRFAWLVTVGIPFPKE